jgi:hypothetical protein
MLDRRIGLSGGPVSLFVSLKILRAHHKLAGPWRGTVPTALQRKLVTKWYQVPEVSYILRFTSVQLTHFLQKKKKVILNN